MVDLNRNNCGICGGVFKVGDWASVVGDAWVHLRCKREAEDLIAEVAHQAGIDFEGHQLGELTTYREEQPTREELDARVAAIVYAAQPTEPMKEWDGYYF